MKKVLLLFTLLFICAVSYAQQSVTTKVTLTVNSQEILDSDRARRGFCVYAIGDTVYLKFSASATDTIATASPATVILFANDYFESSGDSRFTGKVTAKCASGTKDINVTYWYY